MISFDHVFKRYPNGREALRDVSFRVAQGEMVFLTGRSGAGKSSILKLVTLLERPTRGKVAVNGQDTGALPSRAIPAFRRRMGVVFQDHQLLADRPVYDNVALPLIVADTPFREIDRRVRAALDQVGLLGREKSLPVELSIGEQQRVGIARAVVGKPAILVADEPTGNLDSKMGEEVMDILLKLNAEGTTVVMVTHDEREARRTHRIVRVFDGQLVTPEHLHAA